MDRETIEKAARDALLNKPFILGLSRKTKDFQNGFIDGARWRIDSVWHDAKEVPKRGRIIMADCGQILITNVGRYWIIQVHDLGIRRWAYVDDLLPDGKEARNE